VTFFLEIFFTLIIVQIKNRIVGFLSVCGIFSDQNNNYLVVFVDSQIGKVRVLEVIELELYVFYTLVGLDVLYLGQLVPDGLLHICVLYQCYVQYVASDVLNHILLVDLILLAWQYLNITL
jgi:hypothetical protein